MGEHILVIDEGTTSTRAVVFTAAGRIAAEAAQPLKQSFPRPGWVEHDAEQIWTDTKACIEAVTTSIGVANIHCIGITNQRETVVFWDRRSGRPLAPAIVWQDRRTAALCAELKKAGHEPKIQARTGLLLDPYFTGTKISWALDNWPEVRAAANAGSLCVGTVDTYLRYRLSAGDIFETDATNASRTLLMDLTKASWSPELCSLLGVPEDLLPSIGHCAGLLGEARLGDMMVPITGAAGDQHAAAVGQGCLVAGEVKATYGTGAFLIANAGSQPAISKHKLLSTLAWKLRDQTVYALEGSIFVAGSAVQWLRDSLGLIESAAETESLARSMPDCDGVVFVPAFAGLGAPYWEPEARGVISGLTGGVKKAHIVRACLEAMANQTADVLDAMAADGIDPSILKIDGGMVRNDWLCQDLADTLNIEVERPEIIETTALGAAMLAGVGSGLFASLEDAVANMRHVERRFAPQASQATRDERRASWKKAVAQVKAGL
jgi:glycerol kinase|tara:strand:- start:71981 stop:73456 length:1476 start_codon:yes stop_codon:yes gene_type:complete